MPPKTLPSSKADWMLECHICAPSSPSFLAARSMSSHHLLPGKRSGGAQTESTCVFRVIPTLDVIIFLLFAGKRSGGAETETTSMSSSSSSSSLDFNKRINTPNSSCQITVMKDNEHSSTKAPQSLDIRDVVVKDSMYREARCVRIKSFINDDRKVKQQTKLKKTKESVYESTKNSQDERLVFPPFSYDGRESRDMAKTNMKLKEPPRFSLDSKSSSIKCSTLEPSLSFLGRDENENSRQEPPINQESGSHSRSNSIVAKLMGLDTFPDSITTDESFISKTRSSASPSPGPRVAFFSEPSRTTEGRKQKYDSSSPSVSQKNPASPSPRLHNANSLRKQTCLRVPNEPAPWKQQDYNQGSPKMTTLNAKAPTNSPHPSSSVYGEIEKRITALEFKRSGKDLRALKQILEAMQRTRERLENRRDDSNEAVVLHLQKDQTRDPSKHLNVYRWKIARPLQGGLEW